MEEGAAQQQHTELEEEHTAARVGANATASGREVGGDLGHGDEDQDSQRQQQTGTIAGLGGMLSMSSISPN